MTSYSNSTGGNSYGPTAIGPHAQATQHTTGPQERTDPVAELRRLVDAADLPDRDKARVRRDLDDVATELAAPEVDQERVQDALTRISTRAGQVGGIAAVIGQIWATVQQITG